MTISVAPTFVAGGRTHSGELGHRSEPGRR